MTGVQTCALPISIQAERLADNAIDTLNDIIADARDLERNSAKKSDLNKNLAIGGAVVLVLFAFLYIRGRQEELG